jgi:hypothetical protein
MRIHYTIYLTGVIPSELCLLSLLEFIDTTSNLLTGKCNVLIFSLLDYIIIYVMQGKFRQR